MQLIHRSVVAGFLRILGFTLVGAIVLFSLVDLFGHLDNFVDNHASASMVARYYLNKIPWILDTVLPIGMLMATLFTVGDMARYHELSAMFAAGRSLLQTTRPLLALALLACLLSLVWGEFVLPRTNARVARIWEVEIHGNPDRVRPTNDAAFNGADGRLYYVRSFSPERQQIREFRVHTVAGARVLERVDAASADWDGSQWVLADGTRRIFTARGDSLIRFATYASGLDGITPRTFLDDRLKPEAMNARQLRRYIAMIRRSGGDATAHSVDLQFKLSFPVVHLIVVVLGILLASSPRKTTVASGFGWTIAISFGYYLAINFGRSLGHNGTLPPFLAAWAGNLAYAGVAIVAWLRVRR